MPIGKQLLRRLWWLVLSLPACTSLPISPSLLSVTVRPDPEKSGHVAGEIALLITVHNESRNTLHLAVDDESNPPLPLQWTDYSIYKSTPAGWIEDVDRYGNADGVVSLYTLNVGKGDSTILRAYFENAGKLDCSQMFLLELRDTRGRPFRSKPFSPFITP
jgi:hypothetical protein